MDGEEARLFYTLNQFIELTHVDEPTSLNCKQLANLLRLRLLNYLRASFSSSSNGTTYQDVLVQWWLTLLKFISGSNLINDSHYIDLVSVCFECVSRIITKQHCTDNSPFLQIYTHHLVLTVQCVTKKLILISRNSNKSPSTRKYQTILKSFIGKLNAFAFFYIPEFDLQLLNTIKPPNSFVNVTKLHNRNIHFPWKFENFYISSKPNQRQGKYNIPYKILTSYLQNDSILMSFYWNYWYIVCKNSSNSTITKAPGASILLKHIVPHLLIKDFSAYYKFISSKSTNATSPDVCLPNKSIKAETLNTFIFTTFNSIHIWETLRDLSGCIDIKELLTLHDSIFLQVAAKIPAYDSSTSNIIYNKLLQFIIFQFDNLSFLNWDKWIMGTFSLLKTLKCSSQQVALAFWFNSWPFLPTRCKIQVCHELFGAFWDTVATETHFAIIKIMALKLIVFRIINDHETMVFSSLLRSKLEQLYSEMMNFSEIPNITKPPINDKSYLTFNGNSKFAFVPNGLPNESNLIKEKRHSIPSVASIVNVRPSIVSRSGRYPYDILDELVFKANILLSQKHNIPEDSHKETESSMTNSIRSWFAKFSEDNENTNNSNNKNKLIAPPELKYSLSIAKRNKIPIIFKVAVGPKLAIIKKIAEANNRWNVQDDSIFNKPLPLLHQDNRVVDEISFDSLSLTISEDLEMDMRPETRLSKKELPVPDYSLFSINESSSNRTKMVKGLPPIVMRKKLENIQDFIHSFNETVIEYRRFTNFAENDAIFMDFEIKEDMMKEHHLLNFNPKIKL